MNVIIKDRLLNISPTAQAQAEVFWLAFQALSSEAQWVVREQLTQWKAPSPELAVELESWQAAAIVIQKNISDANGFCGLCLYGQHKPY